MHVHIVHQRFQYGEPGKEVTLVAPVPVSTCKSCGSEYTGEEAEEARHDAICRHLGVLTPREIIGLRAFYNLTQAEFSALTGVGEASLKRWENGNTIQNISMDRFLRLLQTPATYEQLRKVVAQQEQPKEHVSQARFQTEFGTDELARARRFKLRCTQG